MATFLSLAGRLEMKPVRHEELSLEDAPVIKIVRYGGPKDGTEFRLVKVHMDDGSEEILWMSNVKDGYFKNVFIPWDFVHPEVIEP